jgi:hypothetical protein
MDNLAKCEFLMTRFYGHRPIWYDGKWQNIAQLNFVFEGDKYKESIILLYGEEVALDQIDPIDTVRAIQQGRAALLEEAARMLK